MPLSPESIADNPTPTGEASSEESLLDSLLSGNQEPEADEAPDAGQEASDDAAQQPTGEPVAEATPEGEADPLSVIDDPAIKSQLEAVRLLREAGSAELADRIEAEIEQKLGLAEPPPPAAEPEAPAPVAAQEFEWNRVTHTIESNLRDIGAQAGDALKVCQAKHAELVRVKEEYGTDSETYRDKYELYQAAYARWKPLDDQYHNHNSQALIVQYVNTVAATDPFIKSNKKFFGDAIADGYVNPQQDYASQITGLKNYLTARGIKSPLPERKKLDPAKVKAALDKLKKASPAVGRRTGGSASRGNSKTSTRRPATNAALRGSVFEGIDIEGR